MTNREFFIKRWASEFPATLGVIRALPENSLEYKPNEKSRTARELVAHIIAHNEDLLEAAESGVINHRVHSDFSSISNAEEKLNKSNENLEHKVSALRDSDWEERIVKFYINGNLGFEEPMGEMFWGFLFDNIHHRGQLTTYIRPMGGKNPSVYGPTADTK